MPTLSDLHPQKEVPLTEGFERELRLMIYEVPNGDINMNMQYPKIGKTAAIAIGAARALTAAQTGLSQDNGR